MKYHGFMSCNKLWRSDPIYNVTERTRQFRASSFSTSAQSLFLLALPVHHLIHNRQRSLLIIPPRTAPKPRLHRLLMTLHIRLRHIHITIQLPIMHPKPARQQKSRHTRRNKRPNQIRVLQHRRKSLAQRRTQRRSKQEKSYYETFHVWRRTRVGDFVGGHVAETFGEGLEDVEGDLCPDGDGGDAGADRTGGCVVAAGRGDVDAPLEDGADGDSDGAEEEAE